MKNKNSIRNPKTFFESKIEKVEFCRFNEGLYPYHPFVSEKHAYTHDDDELMI